MRQYSRVDKTFLPNLCRIFLEEIFAQLFIFFFLYCFKEKLFSFTLEASIFILMAERKEKETRSRTDSTGMKEDAKEKGKWHSEIPCGMWETCNSVFFSYVWITTGLPEVLQLFENTEI